MAKKTSKSNTATRVKYRDSRPDFPRKVRNLCRSSSVEAAEALLKGTGVNRARISKITTHNGAKKALTEETARKAARKARKERRMADPKTLARLVKRREEHLKARLKAVQDDYNKRLRIEKSKKEGEAISDALADLLSSLPTLEDLTLEQRKVERLLLDVTKHVKAR